MRLSFSWLLLSLTALASDPPALRLPEGVRPIKYAADLTLLPDSPTFKAKIDIDVTFAAATTLFYLNSKEIEIATAEVNKTKLTVKQVNDDFIALRALSKIPAGRRAAGVRILALSCPTPRARFATRHRRKNISISSASARRSLRAVRGFTSRRSKE